MTTSPSSKFSSIDICKLSELRSALLEGIKKCGEVVLSVNNDVLRKTILSLEQQSNQYADELNVQMNALGEKSEHIINKEIKSKISIKTKTGNLSLEGQVLKVSRKIESSVIHLYRKMLKEQFSNEGLKKMVKHQMDGIMCTTLQLKLLSRFLHNQ